MPRTATATKPAAKTAPRKTASSKTAPAKRTTAASPAKTRRAAVATPAPVEKKTRRTTATPAPTVRKASAKVNPVQEMSKPASKRRGGNATALNNAQKGIVKKSAATSRELDPVTGFLPGTDSHIIALELLKGGSTRADIIERLRGKLDGQTRNGTEKSVANVLASTFAKLVARGFTVEASYKLVEPTPASKRAATRKANAAAAAKK